MKRRSVAAALDQEASLISQLIDDMLADLGASPSGIGPAVSPRMEGSLFERCIELCREGSVHTRQDEAVRCLHHLSCSGGTLIAKCVASMPNTLLLSEVDPLSRMMVDLESPRFAPTDLISLVRMGDPLASDALLAEMFVAQLGTLLHRSRRGGRRLVLRGHAHSQFLFEADPSRRPTLHALLAPHFPQLSAVTVRDPIDSYLSLEKQGWITFLPATFDEYCRRYRLFLDAHATMPIFRYEDFVHEPRAVMKSICDALQLPFNELFLEVFDAIRISGDSGRRSETVELRQRREILPRLREQAEASDHYEALCKELDYRPIWVEAGR
jgi:hypothetical protein